MLLQARHFIMPVIHSICAYDNKLELDLLPQHHLPPIFPYPFISLLFKKLRVQSLSELPQFFLGLKQFPIISLLNGLSCKFECRAEISFRSLILCAARRKGNNGDNRTDDLSSVAKKSMSSQMKADERKEQANRTISLGI